MSELTKTALIENLCLDSRDVKVALSEDCMSGHFGRVHEWRNHIPEYLVQEWRSLTVEAKLCLLSMAAEVASTEQWD